MQVREYRNGVFLESTRRSALGLCSVYNLLPAEIVETCFSVATFQAGLQNLACHAAWQQFENWQQLYSPRHNLI